MPRSLAQLCVTLFAAWALIGAGCSTGGERGEAPPQKSQSQTSEDTTSTASDEPESTEEEMEDPEPEERPKDDPLIVSVAASAREIIEAVAAEFKKATGTEVRINAGPSSGLAQQIIAGAPCDVFLSANHQWAKALFEEELGGVGQPLLTNSLVIVVPKGNPGAVEGPDDLKTERVKKIALAGEKVPAGMYADQALKKLSLLEPLTKAKKIARGQDVRSALAFVQRGEAEAGIVYSTDLKSAPDVEQVYEFDKSLHDEIAYVLVLVKQKSPHPAAIEFYEFAQSPAADRIYTAAGFTRLPAQ